MTPSASDDLRLPRALHPGAWWAWALGLVTLATRTSDPVVLAAVLATVAVTVAARRTRAPWGGAFRLLLRLGLVVIVLRLAAQVVLGGSAPGTTVVVLPTIGLPGWMAGLRLGGPVTDLAIVLALADGLRIATVLAVVGAANALANPRRLLQAMPPALHGVGVALVVALTFVPSLVTSLARVRSARRLRGRADRGVRGALTIVLPVLDDALDRALALAASMDARGYGRSAAVTGRSSRLLLPAGLAALAVGLVALLDGTATSGLGLVMLVIGAGASGVGLAAAGRGVVRSRYRPDPWRPAEWVTAASGALAGLVALVVPAPTLLDRLDGTTTLVLVAAVALAALPAMATPRPPDHPRALDRLAVPALPTTVEAAA